MVLKFHVSFCVDAALIGFFFLFSLRSSSLDRQILTSFLHSFLCFISFISLLSFSLRRSHSFFLLFYSSSSKREKKTSFLSVSFPRCQDRLRTKGEKFILVEHRPIDRVARRSCSFFFCCIEKCGRPLHSLSFSSASLFLPSFCLSFLLFPQLL